MNFINPIAMTPSDGTYDEDGVTVEGKIYWAGDELNAEQKKEIRDKAKDPKKFKLNEAVEKK